MRLRAREHRYRRRTTETGAGKEGTQATGVENRNERRGEREEEGDTIWSADGKDAGWEREGQGDAAALALVTGCDSRQNRSQPNSPPGGTTEAMMTRLRVPVSQILLSRTITHPRLHPSHLPLSPSLARPAPFPAPSRAFPKLGSWAGWT